MVEPEVIERVARAIYARYPNFTTKDGKPAPLPFEDCPHFEMYLDDARTAIEEYLKLCPTCGQPGCKDME